MVLTSTVTALGYLLMKIGIFLATTRIERYNNIKIMFDLAIDTFSSPTNDYCHAGGNLILVWKK